MNYNLVFTIGRHWYFIFWYLRVWGPKPYLHTSSKPVQINCKISMSLTIVSAHAVIVFYHVYWNCERYMMDDRFIVDINNFSVKSVYNGDVKQMTSKELFTLRLLFLVHSIYDSNSRCAWRYYSVRPVWVTSTFVYLLSKLDGQ